MSEDRRKCAHCGRTIPKNRGDTDWCSKKCYYQAEKADRESMEMERDIQEQAEDEHRCARFYPCTDGNGTFK